MCNCNKYVRLCSRKCDTVFSSQLVDQTMLKVDTNRLGKVSFDEFCKHASQGKLDALTWDTQKARDSMSAITRKNKPAETAVAAAAAAATSTPVDAND
jgi:hypothetical protein